MNNIINHILKRKNKIDSLIRDIEKKLKIMPAGRIRVDKHNNSVYFYHIVNSEDHNGERIDAEETVLIQQLVQKNYLQKVLVTAQKEKKALDDFVRKYPDKTVEEIYDLFSDDRRRLIKPIFPDREQYVEEWQNTPFDRKPIDEGVYTFLTIRGERVRSKSEKIIADALAMNGIPYKYECPLKVGRNLIHPDFTILRKSDLKVFYWEHCGKSDDPDYYSKNIVKRTGIYAEGGIAVGKGLFMTFESSKVPLDSRVVETIINDLK